MNMQRLLLASLRSCTRRPGRRLLSSQQAIRCTDEAVPSSPHRAHSLQGQSYLLPTLTITRGDLAATNTKPTSKHQQPMPIVLDLQQVSSDGSPHAQPIQKQELRSQIEKLQNAGYVPVGITNASEDVKRMGAKLRLPSFISTRTVTHQWDPELQDTEPLATAIQEEPMDRDQSATSTACAEPPMICSSSVRSGQQVYAQDRSLVILGNVNSGAEVLADGDIYVMGTLKGRALAGIGGNVHARIYCQCFDAELISIAHHFTTCDSVLADDQCDDSKQDVTDLRQWKPTCISLHEDRLHFQSAA